MSPLDTSDDLKKPLAAYEKDLINNVGTAGREQKLQFIASELAVTPFARMDYYADRLGLYDANVVRGIVWRRDARVVLLLLEPVLHIGGRVDTDHEAQYVYSYQHPKAQPVRKQTKCQTSVRGPTIALAIGPTAV